MVFPPSQYGKVCWKLWWPLLSEPQPSQSAETSKVIIRIITLWSLGGNFWMMKFWLDSKSEGSLRPRFWWGKMSFRDPKPLGWPWLTQKLMVRERNLPMLTSHSWIQLEYFFGNRFVSLVEFHAGFSERRSSKFQQQSWVIGAGPGSKPSIRFVCAFVSQLTRVTWPSIWRSSKWWIQNPGGEVTSSLFGKCVRGTEPYWTNTVDAWENAVFLRYTCHPVESDTWNSYDVWWDKSPGLLKYQG